MRILLVILLLAISCIGSEFGVINIAALQAMRDRLKEQAENGVAFNKDWISAISGIGGGSLDYSTPHKSCSNEKNMRLTAVNTAWCAANPIVKGEAYMQVNAGRFVNWKGIGIYIYIYIYRYQRKKSL